MSLSFDNTYARLPEHFYERIAPTPVSEPSWLATNARLAALLGIASDELSSDAMLSALAGNRLLEGSEPIALAYAGHQFGGFSPKLGDGRAVLLGEVLGIDGARRDIQLKGSGPTSFSRRGDGRAAIGPVLREFIVSEAMFALGVPTTQSLAAVATGEPVFRETMLPGAVLTRVASSHLRVGTFEYFGRRGDADALLTLTNYALERHYSEHQGSEFAPLALLDAVMTAQATLIAKWMNLGFVHGVMNTDNCSIAGETIDYGPCAFLDVYDPARTFSSIDHGGRYAFGNQSRIGLWNMARLAEALLPLFGDVNEATVRQLEERLGGFESRFEGRYGAGLCAKLGLEHRAENVELGRQLLQLMQQGRVDFTQAFRRLTDVASDTGDSPSRPGCSNGNSALRALAVSLQSVLTRCGEPTRRSLRATTWWKRPSRLPTKGIWDRSNDCEACWSTPTTTNLILQI
jgi:serine/tyrosine/threonine adenylyltransferase